MVELTETKQKTDDSLSGGVALAGDQKPEAPPPVIPEVIPEVREEGIEEVRDTPPISEKVSKPPPADLASRIFKHSMRNKPPEKKTLAKKIVEKSERSALRDALLGVNVGLTDIADFPFDVVATLTNVVMRALGLPEASKGNVRSIFDRLGFTPTKEHEPDTMSFSTGRFTGQSLAFLPLAPLGTAVQTAQKTVQPLLPTIKEGAKSVAKQIGETAVKSPKKFIALETTVAAGGGAAGFGAKELFPNSEVAEMYGQIFGSLGTSAVVALNPTGMAVRLILNQAKKFRADYKGSGAETRASKRVSRDIDNPELAKQNIQDEQAASLFDVDGELLPGAKLTPAQTSGDPLLLTIEKSIIESADDLIIRSDKQIAELNAAIIQSMEASPSGVEGAKSSFEGSIEYLRGLLEKSFRIAGLRAKARLEKLSPSATREDASKIVNEEITKSLDIALKTEDELWAAFPREVEIKPSIAMKVLEDELRGRVRTDDPSDIPEFIISMLGKLAKKGKGKEKSIVFKPGVLKKNATAGEIHNLRKRILQAIREEMAKPAPNRNRLRIWGDLQEGLLVDLKAEREMVSGPVGESYRRAIDFSTSLNDKYRKGPVGRLFGSDKTGTPALVPGLTLERTLGGGGSAARENVRAIIRAVQENPDDTLAAMENFIKAKFLKAAVRNDEIDVTKAENFMRSNAETLNEFPLIKQDLEESIRTQSTRLARKMRMQNINKKLSNPRISLATLYIEGSPAKAFEAVRVSRNPGKEIERLITLAKKDSSGEALRGLQESFLDWLLRRASVGTESAAGEPFILGSHLNRIVAQEETKTMADTLLTVTQKTRLDQAIATAMRLDAARTAKQSKEGVIGDVQSAILDFFGRVGGAQLGRVVAGKVGGGTVQTPGIFSERVRALFKKLIQDDAKKILIDAFTSEDTKLLEALLREIKTEKDLIFVSRQLNAWMAATLHEAGQKGIESIDNPDNKVGELSLSLSPEPEGVR